MCKRTISIMLDTLNSSAIVDRILSSTWAFQLVDDAVQNNNNDRNASSESGAETNASDHNEAVSNAELVARVRAGDKAAEAIIYKRFSSGLTLMLHQRTRDMSRAEDLVQDTMITVITRLRDRGIDEPAALAGFIQQTAKYTFIGWLRRAGNQVELRESFDEESQDEPTEVDKIGLDRRRVAVRALISEMKVPRDREILFRYYVREQGKPVICEALDLEPNHFDRVINRARNRFKQLAPAEWGNDV